MIKSNHRYIDFNTILDYLEGKLDEEACFELERYLEKYPVDQAALEGVRLIYEQEGMGREELILFLKNSFPEYDGQLAVAQNSKSVFVSPYRYVIWIQTLSSAAAFILICFMTMLAFDKNKQMNISVKIKVPCELGYGVDWTYATDMKEI